MHFLVISSGRVNHLVDQISSKPCPPVVFSSWKLDFIHIYAYFLSFSCAIVTVGVSQTLNILCAWIISAIMFYRYISKWFIWILFIYKLPQNLQILKIFLRLTTVTKFVKRHSLLSHMSANRWVPHVSKPVGPTCQHCVDPFYVMPRQQSTDPHVSIHVNRHVECHLNSHMSASTSTNTSTAT